MATTTYSINPVTGQTLVNGTTAGNQVLPSVVSTPDGGAAVFYLNGTKVDGRLLNSNGNPTGPEALLSGAVIANSGPTATRLTNGDFAVAWTEATTPNRIDIEVLAPDLTPITAILHPTSLPNAMTEPSVAALTDGSFVVSYNFKEAGPQSAIDFSRFTANGSETITDDLFDSTGLTDTTHALEFSHATGLRDGGFAIAYDELNTSTGGAVIGAVMKVTVFNANNTVRSQPSVFDMAGTGKSSEDAVSLPNGGFAVSYQDNQYTGNFDMTTAFFNSAGTLQAFDSATNASGPDFFSAAQEAVSPDGYLFTTQTNAPPGSFNNFGSLIAPNRTVLANAKNFDALGGKTVSDATWLNSSNVLVTQTSVQGSMLANGIVSSGEDVDSVVLHIERDTTGDSATPLDFSGDGIDNVVELGSGNDTVFGGRGSNFIVGNGGNDEFVGGAGGNTIYALGGNNYLQGGTGSPSDVLVATGAGTDTFYGGSGNNYIVGGTGENTIVGGVFGLLQTLYAYGSGGDYIVGGENPNASNVLAELGTGAAQLWGGPGNNYEVGGLGNDLLVGGNNSDYLFGANGDDTLYVGNGTDYIYPGPGDDFIWTDNIGSQSTDYIYEGVGTGVDTIADFTPGNGTNHDVLVLSAPSSEIVSFADVQAKAFQAGIYTVLPLSNTDQIFLYNVQPSQLTANDFIFT